ncbi:MAG TPA: hypothetical protein VJ741_12870 [Solirubrobacteraceae bacterium]|nr:hypothetical protein [Solirubrobacteraceae bacterium]
MTRTWNEWSASEGHHGRTRYERYLAAVAAEERAAIRLEQALDMLGASSASASVAVSDHPVVPSPPG